MRKIGTIKGYEIFEDKVNGTRYYGIRCEGNSLTPHCGYKYLEELLNYKGLKVKQVKWIPTEKKLNHLGIGGYKRYFYQCDEGNRWSECEWERDKPFYGKAGQVSDDMAPCYFSGCKEDDHKIKLIKVLDGHSEESRWFVHNWFKSIYRKPLDNI